MFLGFCVQRVHVGNLRRQWRVSLQDKHCQADSSAFKFCAIQKNCKINGSKITTAFELQGPSYFLFASQVTNLDYLSKLV